MGGSPVISRGLAIVMGLDRYFTGQPCSNGHVAERYLNRQCVECRSETLTPQQSHVLNRRRAQKAYYQSNRDALNKKSRDYNRANAAKKTENDRAWRSANQERERARVRAYYHADPAKGRAKASAYRALKLRATPRWLTQEHHEQIASIYRCASDLSIETGIPHEVDHVIPLAGKIVCGLHVPWNLRSIPQADNRKKSNLLIDQNA